jgi:MYXO-CTERM domain-containing protein
MSVTAGDHRADLCTTINSCDHGFSIGVPLGVQDGKSHPVHAYGVDPSSGAKTELSGSPKNIDCPNAKPPLDAKAGVKRHVVDTASMTAWAFSKLVDIAPEPDSVIQAYPDAADWSEKPSLAQADDGTATIWLLDGKTRRRVVSPASLAAWHRKASDVVKTPAATIATYPQGPDLPADPFLVIGSGPSVWVIDVSPATPPAPAPNAGPDNVGDGEPQSNDAAPPSDGGGCSVQTSRPSPAAPAAPLLGLSLLAALRRRRRSSP